MFDVQKSESRSSKPEGNPKIEVLNAQCSMLNEACASLRLCVFALSRLAAFLHLRPSASICG
jgi:hypothetical protein